MNKLAMLVSFLCLISSPLYAVDKAKVISHKNKSLQWGPCPPFIPKGCEIAVIQDVPTENNHDIFFKVPGDFHIPYHKHTSQERMVLVFGTLDVIYDNHEKATIKTGEYAFGSTQLPLSAYCHKGEDCVLNIEFVTPLDAIPLQKP